MFSRIGFILCAGVWLMIGAAISPSGGYNQNISCRYEAQQIHSQSSKAETLAGEFSSNTQSPNQAKKQDQTRERLTDFIACDDLKAQQFMALVAFWGVWIGLLGLATIVLTLLQTSKASGAASETLRIAEETLTESRKATAAEIRPYLIFENVQVNAIGDWITQNRETYTVELEVKNIGKYPALNVSLHTSENRDKLFSEAGEILKFCGHLAASATEVYGRSTGSPITVSVNSETDVVSVVRDIEIRDGYRTQIYVGVEYSDFSGGRQFRTVTVFDLMCHGFEFMGPQYTVKRDRKIDEAT